MPLDGGGTASKPAGTTAVAGATIESSKFNSVIDDLYAILNAARPVVYGGTGATSASAARTALGLAIGSDVQAYDAALASLAGLAFVSGDIVYATTADTLARLAKGTDGQFLSLASGVPAWATVSDGGWTQIGSAVTPSGASVIITSIPAGYKQLAVRLSRVEFVAAETLQLKVSVNNGSSYATAMAISAALGSGTIDVSGLVIIDAPDPGAAYKRTIIPNTVSSAGTAYNMPALADVTGDIDAIRLDGVASANFDGGKVELWGIK